MLPYLVKLIFCRCEWQDRGSVHVHCLLWSLLGKDVEQWLDNEEGHQKIKDLVDSTISASLPKLPPNDNTEGESNIIHLRTKY